jgi:AcrR family transcriptional regulator
MTVKPPLRARKKTRTWDAITSAAWSLFIRNGFAATTLDQIAEAADVHKQTVLRYFRSKEEIALADQLRRLEEFETGLLDPARTGSVMAYWRDHIARSARRVRENGGVFRAFRVIQSDPRLFARFMALDERYQALLAKAFSAEAGVDPEKDLHSIALSAMLVAANAAVAREVLGKRQIGDIEAACQAVVDFATARFPARSFGDGAPAW